ncbi:hypothetical protein HAZT_HAZT009359 [Hyalella azteca]|uniref:EGF-like domain-containing protein n=1 Tax=Hyalella azteca TaxID=294128 RepID=A0A6A0GUL1_HYAAZ|nr:hypothetical protein HAZT_HAZT009359 [Hyalella azteca]
MTVDLAAVEVNVVHVVIVDVSIADHGNVYSRDGLVRDSLPCADGYMGQRCEYKDLDGSYLPTGDKVLLETASIAGGAALVIILVFFGIFSAFALKNKRSQHK